MCPKLLRIEMTDFKLSIETKEFLRESTGLDYNTLTTKSIADIIESIPAVNKKKFSRKEAKQLTPRGSVYLYLGRILSLKDVRRIISKYRK